MNKRGWLRIVEVVLASALLLTYLGYVMGNIGVERAGLEEMSDAKEVAKNTLFLLDQKSIGSTTFLRARARDKNFESLRTETDAVIPAGYLFEYKIGDDWGGEIPTKSTIAHQTYFVVLGDGTPEVVRLYVWGRG